MMILILVCVVVIMYGRTLNYGYCIDDFDIAKKSVGKPKPKSAWGRIYYSWQGIQYHNPVLAHRITFILHLANTILVYLVFGRTWLSFLVALLFTLHPAGTQTSVWLSGKAYSTVLFFALLTVWIPWGAAAWYYLGLTYGGFSAAFLPALLIPTSAWWWSLLIPLGFIVKFKRIWTALSAKWKITPRVTRTWTPRRIIIYFKSLGYYTWMAIFPMRLGVYHNYLYTFGLSKEDTEKWYKPDLFLPLGLATFSLFVYLLAFHRAAPVTFGVFWFVVFISQWCNYPVTLQQAIAERYFSLPMIGAMFALVNGIALLPDPVVRSAAYAAFITGFAVRLNIHIQSYRNIHFQIDHNLTNFPECYAIWTWKGQEEKNRGSFFTAIEAWFQGWKLRKTDFRLNNNIAVMLTAVGQLDQASDFLKLAEANIPEDQKAAGMEYINTARAEIDAIRRKADLGGRIIVPGRGGFRPHK